jgi:cytochrome c oxidase assembly factor CtaG/putative copper export protein
VRRVVLVTAVASVPSVSALALLWTTGGLAPLGVPGLPEAGPATRVGLPLVQGVRDLAAAATVGLLVVAAWCAPPDTKDKPEELTGARRRMIDQATIAAVAWATTSMLMVALTYSDASGARIDSPGFLEQAAFFGTDFELGRYLLSGAGIAALVAIGGVLFRTATGSGVLVLLAVAGLWTMSLTGHAAGTLYHDVAVDLQFLHLVAVSVWVGGLIALVLSHRALGQHLAVTVQRYSVLAGGCLVVVAVSGVLGAAVRVQTVAGIWSTYGAVLILKSSALIAVGAIGWWQRNRLVLQLTRGRRRAFLHLSLVEVTVLASATGAGVALSRTAPESALDVIEPLSAAETMIGSPLPPELGALEWFTQWSLDTLWLVLALAMIGSYLLAVRRLRQRGDRWSMMRTAAWVIGWLLLVWATNGAPGTYGRVLFSMHMVQHMTIATAVPAFLVIGAPMTLALRALRRRQDGSAGPREWLLRVALSLPAQVLGTPIVAGGLFIGSLVAFYYSSLFELSLESHTAHLVMIAHFLVSGYLLYNCLIGIDPGPERPAYPFRALIVMVTFGFHALFSVSLMASNQVLAADWFGALGRTWGRDLLADQEYGAAIGWVLGEYPLALIAGTLVALWVQADRRERRRFDRSETRTNDEQLAAYNERLRELAEASERHSKR